jgi:DNA-binding NtrC family response regulator
MNTNPYPSVLIVDDHPPVCASLRENLSMRNYRVSVAYNSREALKLLRIENQDLMLLDVRLGEENGVSLLPRILEIDPSLPVIVITGYGTVEIAVESIKRGAFDYLEKPIKIEKLLKTMENALYMSRLERENSLFRKSVLGLPIATESAVMRDMLLRARKLAASNLPILVYGESGTGKELLAEMIHAESSRSMKPLHRVNCAAFSESLLESELFGHERGAFTGAVERFPGVFERSNGGTLFLDEIGDMGLSSQAKILRVLQNQELRRVGGKETIKVDVRFIAATNKDLDGLTAEGKFRSDLLYRLNAAILCLPPLRERREDIVSLAKRFIADYGKENGCHERRTLSPRVLELLMSHDWPGNIRELKGAIYYACAVSEGPEIQVPDLPELIARGIRRKPSANPLETAEIACIAKTLREEGNNKVRAAERLSISRSTLYKKISQYGL